MEFNIGERVRNVYGNIGTIEDRMSSDKTGTCYYKVHFDGNTNASTCLYKGEDLELVREEAEYTYEFEFLENLVVARLYEIVDGDIKKEIAKGHGHIIHDGAYGIAQAASYALKRICDNLNGGSLKTYKKD